MFIVLPFFSWTDKNKSALRCSLSPSICVSLCVSLPVLPFLSDPLSRSQLFSHGGAGQDVIVVMVTDGCARFTKTNFSCCEKRPHATHQQQSIYSKQLKHQDGYTWEENKPLCSNYLTTCVCSLFLHG